MIPSRPAIHQDFLRSFGRIKSRVLSTRQQGLLNEFLPKVAVKLPEEGKALLPAALYDAPVKQVALEIGFGGGEHLAALAGREPEAGFIGCEPFTNGVASLLTHIEEKNLHNIRILHGDVRLLLERLAPESIDRAYILFPDPWPKARHHKKRLINHALLDMLHRVLKPGAELLIATDHPSYQQWIAGHLTAREDFAELPRNHQEPPTGWVETRYQQKARKQGREAVFFIAKRQ